MCDGGSGGGDGDGFGGATGAGEDPGGDFGGSGGNVGPGVGPTGAGTGRGGMHGFEGDDPTGMGSVSTDADFGGITGDINFSGLDADFEGINADINTARGFDSNEGIFGFDSSQGAQAGFMGGSLVGGLPTGLIGGLIGGLMGAAQEGGDVGDYGGPEGGGPGEIDERVINPKPPGWGKDDGGYFSNPTSSGGGEVGGFNIGSKPAEGLIFSGDSGLSQYKQRALLKDRDALGKDFIEDEELRKFTRTLF